ncbi:MAG: diacylglycerol kinase family protein [Dysgonamonadaceae bacterium]|jgi:undecaprenol kinase/diacylglycerol kinase (ATP)|nr:diacylglycerol kinase family protein [Dysgonamonadaceae bacterium]
MEQDSPKKQSRLKSFAVAFRGLKIIFVGERNFRIQLLLGLFAVIACFFFQVTTSEWIVVLLLIAVILSTEALNTCIEYICDYISPEYHHMIKKIKDVAAGAVLLCVIIAVVITCIIFIPYIHNMLSVGVR